MVKSAKKKKLYILICTHVTVKKKAWYMHGRKEALERGLLPGMK